MSYYISAYATSPSSNRWAPTLEASFFEALAENPEVLGIEHPYLLSSERYPLDWLLENIPNHWSIIITALPQSMNEMKNHPYFGLASQNEEGRLQALGLMQKVSQYIQTLNDAFGRQIVKALHFHSLPRNHQEALRGSQVGLKRSLDKMQRFDWQGIQLNLEHCDAYSPNQPADKGFLPLEEELNVLTTLGNYGIVLNWARSAIEERSTKTPLKHIEMAQKAGLLKGFFFSGCTDILGNHYGFWKDTHMPPKNFIEGDFLPVDSLLDKAAIKSTLHALANEEKAFYYGIKVADCSQSNEVAKKIGLNLETIKAINIVKSELYQEYTPKQETLCS